MASLCVRLFQNSRRNLYTTATRFDKLLDDPLNVATGIEKRELLAIESGNDDPFAINVIKRAKGTKDCPNEIPSACDSRIMGCVCQEEATTINWMWLHQGQPRRCNCGHWFKLVYKPPV